MDVSVFATATRTDHTSSRASCRNTGTSEASTSSFRIAAPTMASARAAATRIWNWSSKDRVINKGAKAVRDTSGPNVHASEPIMFAPETRISSSSHCARFAIWASSVSRASSPVRSAATVATAVSAADTTPSTSSSTNKKATHSKPVYTSSSCRVCVSLSACAKTPSCSATICRTSPSSSCARSSTRSRGNVSSPARMARRQTSPRLRTWK
mmetsp:Transcript_13042/g.43226  ORF Transcript_13042/g.43226 Transcript_13042/m.43226 type:complete len:211 (-) Transcript_13042:251-883(-)